MRIKKVKSIICKDDGSAIGLFVIILLSMTFLATASVTLAQTQYSWARFSRQTSNSYHLARSGAEKIVDSMNKEVATILPDLMKEASKLAHNKLMGLGSNDGVKYEGPDAYTGKYVGAQYENEYEIQLKNLIYTHIVDKFITNPVVPAADKDYTATKSDVKNPIEIEVKTNVYKNGSTTVPADLTSIANNLVTDAEMLNPLATTEGKDAFMVEVTAWAEEGAKLSLTKSRVVGTISLKQLLKEEQLLEEYEWADAYPEVLQSAIVSFGDFIINGRFKAKVEGDIRVKGTRAVTEPAAGKFPKPDEFGGIVISDGGTLEVEGNALVVNNIQTTNTNDMAKIAETTKINITKDAIAETIAINDNESESPEPWKTFVSNNTIKIGRNVYMDNDLRIDRYVKSGEIEVGESVFGVSDGDKNGVKVGPLTYVDPNKSSGIYATGKLDDDNSKIKMERAFIAGQAFINFGDGKGFHRLHESAGEPFEDVYYLDQYRMAYGEDIIGATPADNIIGGDSDDYITDFADLIRTDRIKIGEQDLYAPALISGTVGASNALPGPSIISPDEARGLFYLGLGGSFPAGIRPRLTGSSDWADHILGISTNPTWESVILEPLDFYTGNNPFKKNYFLNPDPSAPPVTYADLAAYKGLQGYMLGKRGVFYKHFEKPLVGTAPVTVKERVFSDLVDVGVFTTAHTWSRNNPIDVITLSRDVELKDYKNRPTAIVCTDPTVTITLKSTPGNRNFTGIIVTPGKVIIDDEMTINGIIIAGNENPGAIAATTKDIREGKHAGIQITTNSNVVFKYDVTAENDRNMIFDIRFMDKSLQRKLYDCLGMTNYASAPPPALPGAPNNDEARIDAIFGTAGERKVKLSNESVISANQDGLQFVMKSLKKIKN